MSGILPIRCFTCNKCIGDMWEKFFIKCQEKDMVQVFIDLKINRACCRRMFSTSVDIHQQVEDYRETHDKMETNPFITQKTTYVSKRVYLAR